MCSSTQAGPGSRINTAILRSLPAAKYTHGAVTWRAAFPGEGTGPGQHGRSEREGGCRGQRWACWLSRHRGAPHGRDALLGRMGRLTRLRAETRGHADAFWRFGEGWESESERSLWVCLKSRIFFLGGGCVRGPTKLVLNI